MFCWSLLLFWNKDFLAQLKQTLLLYYWRTYICICAIMKTVALPVITTMALWELMHKCMSCHKAIVVITRRAHCFHDCIYITPILLLWDLSTLCVVDHLWPLYICLRTSFGSIRKWQDIYGPSFSNSKLTIRVPGWLVWGIRTSGYLHWNLKHWWKTYW